MDRWLRRLVSRSLGKCGTLRLCYRFLTQKMGVDTKQGFQSLFRQDQTPFLFLGCAFFAGLVKGFEAGGSF